jgi:hypothetical protein
MCEGYKNESYQKKEKEKKIILNYPQVAEGDDEKIIFSIPHFFVSFLFFRVIIVKANRRFGMWGY